MLGIGAAITAYLFYIDDWKKRKDPVINLPIAFN
jgi:hypothetical protein